LLVLAQLVNVVDDLNSRVIVDDAQDHEAADVGAYLHQCAEDDEEFERALLRVSVGLTIFLQSRTGSQHRQNYRGSLNRD